MDNRLERLRRFDRRLGLKKEYEETEIFNRLDWMLRIVEQRGDLFPAGGYLSGVSGSIAFTVKTATS
jgi:hypothetical protein